MRRRAGTRLPLERDILDAGLALSRQGTPEWHGFAIAREFKERGRARQRTAFALLRVGLLDIGRLSLRRCRLPRWLGALATVSGACVALAFSLAAVGQEGDIIMMTGLLVGLIWFVATSVWLVAHGTAEREIAPAVQSS